MIQQRRPAAGLAIGDVVLTPPFGSHQVEHVEQLPGSAIRVDLDSAIVLYAGPAYEVDVLIEEAA